MIEATRNKCRELWEKGMTYEKIGRIVGYTGTNVAHELRKTKHRHELKCIFPGLEAWRNKHGMTVSGLCHSAGIDPIATKKLTGEEFTERLMMWQINALLKLTGLTYEEAFGGVDVD